MTSLLAASWSPDTSCLTSRISPTPPPPHLLLTPSWSLCFRLTRWFSHRYLSVLFLQVFPAPLPVIPAAPSAAPVPADAPRVAPRPPVVPLTDPVSPAAPCAAPVPSPAPERYAQPVQVYRRRSAPNPAPQRYAEPVQVYRRRSASTPAPPPATEAPATPTPEPSPSPPPPAPSRAEPEVYHPPVIHWDPRHIHPTVTWRMTSQPATLSSTESHGSLRYPPLSATPWRILTGVARWKRSTRLFLLTRRGTSCRVRLVAMW